MANKIFISYSHDDSKWKDEIVKFLKGHGETKEYQFDPWEDSRIKAGDDWRTEIDRAMQEARLALLLLTANFVTSEFIKEEELYKLLRRTDVRVIPIAVEPGGWQSWPSLKKIQVRPNPDRPLSMMKKGERQQALTNLVAELATILKGEPATAFDLRLEELFARTVCSRLDDAQRSLTARALTAFLREHTQLEEGNLLKAARFLIEHRLLTARDAHCQLGPAGNVLFPEGNKEIRAALQNEMDQPNDRRFASPRVQTAPGAFLERTLERAEDWHDYFKALKLMEEPVLKSEDIQTLCLVDIEGTGGAIAPQYLLAGLMSHFHDDWKPVIDSYTMVGSEASKLERLKASQWICWLVWGPSIPLCKCQHWLPLSAYQFGYGDENNSLPVYLTDVPDSMRNLLRDPENGERRAIEVDRMVGRLAWGPFTFSGPNRFAQAQARLTQEEDENDRANVHQSDGLLIKVEEARPRDAHADEPAYFTSYIWLMFWVARKRDHGSAATMRLNGRPLPQPAPDLRTNSQRLSKDRLWEDLLPVFVHANIFDPVVLRFQKGMLIENALHLLKRMRAQSDAPVEFHLVCASDYSGCGCEIEFPPPQGESLVSLFRTRLDALPENERTLADSVHLPQENEPNAMPPMAFRAFLSACHLPEMIEGYYEFLRRRVGASRVA